VVHYVIYLKAIPTLGRQPRAERCKRKKVDAVAKKIRAHLGCP